MGKVDDEEEEEEEVGHLPKREEGTVALSLGYVQGMFEEGAVAQCVGIR
jgi:hypothetical protein